VTRSLHRSSLVLAALGCAGGVDDFDVAALDALERSKRSSRERESDEAAEQHP
jgi:hypothetical protein